YKKHYPPALHDEVWRLDKIGRDGAFHRRLNNERIYTVLDFLRLVSIDHQRLRNVLGTGMSNKMWEGTVDHAKTCVLDNKLYVYYADEQRTVGVIFNVICELVGVIVDGQYILVNDLSETQKVFVSKMVKHTYEHWNEVVEYDPNSLTDGRGGQSDIDSQVAIEKVMHQHQHSLDPSNNVWMPYLLENSDIPTPSQFAVGSDFTEQNIVPQTVLSSALALGTEQVAMNTLQSAYDTQIMDPYPHSRNECIEKVQIGNEYAQKCIKDHSAEASIRPDNWNGDCHEALEGLSFTGSGEKLVSGLDNQGLDGADLQAHVQSLIQIMNAGTSGQPNNLFYSMEGDEAFSFKVFTPVTDVSLTVSTRRLNGKASIFWLKLKAALKWGISVRKVAAAKRARLEEIGD
ncbi:hypothetical protein KI387_034905, partial [Taxus chinensis]